MSARMTDWMPLAGVALAGTFATLAFTLEAIGGRAAALSRARWSLVVTAAASALLYGLYLVRGERWLWY